MFISLGFVCLFLMLLTVVDGRFHTEIVLYGCSLLLSHPQNLSSCPSAAGAVCVNLASADEPMGHGLPDHEPIQRGFSAQLLSLASLVDSFSLSLVYSPLDLRYLDKSTTFILSQVPIRDDLNNV